ncbi:alpha/beta fold hydrolase [Falsiroseomonas oryziterrae]|uniref:alpha/beta fold hydrolase n=1 Tax=Falsiroseomonas oryziterrae TaxID=2911368 RepID=UPI001F3CFEC0|nr:alpha/beta hydrolase [Roseomonas sp. NPKOSM-4]
MSVVLLHGIGGPSWGDVVPDALDWPMPGFCGTAPLQETTFPALAVALRDALDARGIGRATLVGHSMGGMLALEFAATFPERVAKLVLYATTPAFGGRDPSFAEAFLKARLGPLEGGRSMAEAAPEMLTGMFEPGADPQAIPKAAAAMATIPEQVYRDTVRCLTTFDRRADLARIAVPTLLIAGECDQAAPAKTMQRMAEAIPGARIVVIPGAGHMIHLEQPAAFRAALLPFLAE